MLAVAVVLGFLLLGGTDEIGLSTTSQSSSNESTTTTEFTAPEQQQAPTTAQPPAGSTSVKPPGEVKVVVLNGSGGLAKGVAGASTEKLQGLGYQTIDPGNAEAREVTVVLFAEGFQPDAEAIKTALGVSGTVELLEDPPSPEAAGANVIVLLGQDAASLVEGAEDSTTTTTEE